jgi:predicted DsbA family dithiol-disulfide isomerase
VLDKYPQEVKLVYKNFPLVLHRFAEKAAIGALAADKQRKFWEMHRKLFENHKALDDAKMQEIAKEIGLDMEKFNTDMQNPALRRLVIKDMQEGQRARVRGIPTIFCQWEAFEEKGQYCPEPGGDDRNRIEENEIEYRRGLLTVEKGTERLISRALTE